MEAQASFEALELEVNEESDFLRLMKALSSCLDSTWPLLSLDVSNPLSIFSFCFVSRNSLM